MRRHAVLGAAVLALIAPTPAHAGDHVIYQTQRSHFLHKFHPEGGWNPGGGLCHWWDACCLPQACGPNDYCRKPYPNLCRYPVAPPHVVPGHPQAPGFAARPTLLR